MRKSSLFVEKYRPEHVKDVIMPKPYRNFFNKIISSGDVPNLVLYSSPGTGKCLCESETIKIMVTEEFYEQYKDLFED